MRNMCCLENVVIVSMQNPIQDMSTSVNRFVNGLHLDQTFVSNPEFLIHPENSVDQSEG